MWKHTPQDKALRRKRGLSRSNHTRANRTTYFGVTKFPKQIPAMILFLEHGVFWVCVDCHEHKPKEKFTGYTDKRTGERKRTKYCYECHKKREEYRNNVIPGRRIERKRRFYELHLKREYGITEQERTDLLLKNNGLCPICLQEPKMWHIDHCHNSGKVRGLLCQRCNQAIGLLKENPESMLRAIEYLKAHSPSSVINN